MTVGAMARLRSASPARITFAVLAVLLLAAAGYRQAALPSYTHRYRLTLEAEADGEVRRGSGVVEVTWQRQPEMGMLPPWSDHVRGDAVVVELGGRGVLLAALSGGPASMPAVQAPYLALNAFADAVHWPPTKTRPPAEDELAALRRRVGQRRALAPEALPRLYWLPDPADPATTRPVRAARMPSEIAPGVRLLDATIEITTDRVTTGIGDRLPWLRELWRRQHRNGIIAYPDQFVLTAASLFRGRDWSIEP